MSDTHILSIILIFEPLSVLAAQPLLLKRLSQASICLVEVRLYIYSHKLKFCATILPKQLMCYIVEWVVG